MSPFIRKLMNENPVNSGEAYTGNGMVILSQAQQWEGATTMAEASRIKRSEARGARKGDDIVWARAETSRRPEVANPVATRTAKL